MSQDLTVLHGGTCMILKVPYMCLLHHLGEMLKYFYEVNIFAISQEFHVFPLVAEDILSSDSFADAIF